ncbi:Adenylate cyclase [Diplonema papillatum]|nr:Adenylate cyclase [Diplonema papillatum]
MNMEAAPISKRDSGVETIQLRTPDEESPLPTRGTSSNEELLPIRETSGTITSPFTFRHGSSNTMSSQPIRSRSTDTAGTCFTLRTPISLIASSSTGGTGYDNPLRRSKQPTGPRGSQDSMIELAGNLYGGERGPSFRASLQPLPSEQLEDAVNHMIPSLDPGPDNYSEEEMLRMRQLSSTSLAVILRWFASSDVSTGVKLAVVVLPMFITSIAFCVYLALSGGEKAPIYFAFAISLTVASSALSAAAFVFVYETIVIRRNTLKRDLRWKLELESSSHRFVPHECLRLLGYTALSAAKVGHHAVQNVCVCFADIRDFTKISQGMDNNEAFDWINGFTSRMTPVIRRHNGFVNAYLGDGIMSIFTEANEAVLAGIQMQQSLDVLNTQRTDRYHVVIGIGIHWGAVTIGMLGDERRLGTALLGQTVNVANKIESLTKTYGTRMLISDAAFDRLETSNIAIRCLGNVTVEKLSMALYDVYEVDPPRLKQYKEAISTVFDRAVAACGRGEYDAAIRDFVECLTSHGSTVSQPLDYSVEVCIYYAAAEKKKQEDPESSHGSRSPPV